MGTQIARRERQRQIVLVLTALMWHHFVSLKVTLPAHTGAVQHTSHGPPNNAPLPLKWIFQCKPLRKYASDGDVQNV